MAKTTQTNQPLTPLVWHFFTLLWRFNPRWLVSRVFLIIAGSLIPIAQLVVAKQIIDLLVNASFSHRIDSWPQIVSFVILEAAFYFANLLVTRIDSKLNDIYTEELSPKIENYVLTHVARLDVASYDNAEFYNQMETLYGQTFWRTTNLYEIIFSILSATITLIATIGLFLVLPIWIVSVLIVFSLPIFLTQNRYGHTLHLLEEQSRERLRLANYYGWLMIERGNVEDIKLYGLEPTFIARITAIFRDYLLAYAQIARRFLVYELGVGVVALMARTGIVLWLAWSTVVGRLTIGQFTLYSSLFNQLAQGLNTLLRNLGRLSRFRQFLSYLRVIETSQPIIREVTHPKRLNFRQPVEIQFDHVSFTYPGQKDRAIRNLSFTLKAGEHLALVGENGAGKTTVVKLLARFYDPTHGRITINGIDLRDYRLRDVHRFLGIIFQDFARFQARVEENIGFGEIKQLSQSQLVEKAARKSGAHSFIERLDHRYATMLSREFAHGAELSGGEWQKIALARTFFREARLLILDEPTAALDAQAEEHFYKQFLKLEKNTSAILISHRFSTVRMADTILVLDKGRVIEQGSHTELIHKNGRYATLFHLQAKRYQ